MSDQPIFGGLTGEQLVELCADQTVEAIRAKLYAQRGIMPSDDVTVIARGAAARGAVTMLAELARRGMIAEPKS